MSYTKAYFFDETSKPYSEVLLDNDPGYQEWLNDRQDEREAQENLEELFNELEGRHE